MGEFEIIQQHINNTLVKDYFPTIEDYYKSVCKIDEESTPLSVFDTSGMEDYLQLIDNWIDKKDAFILTFSVECLDSLNRLEVFYNKINARYQHKGSKGPVIVIVANNADSPNRVVEIEDGKKFAKRLGCEYFEASSATGLRIEDVFNSIVREFRSRRQEKLKKQMEKPKKPWYDACALC